MSERDHLETAALRGDRQAKADLAGSPCPAAAEHIWGMFRALDHARGGNGFGLNPISHAELEAYTGLHGLALTPFELACLRALDGKRLEIAAEEARK